MNYLRPKIKRVASEQAQVAKIIKAKLKAAGIPCTTKSASFAGGDSVRITVKDQPPWIMKAIEEKTDCYEYGTFDGMTDCQGFKNRDFDGPQTKYLHIQNDISEEIQQEAWLMLCDKMQELIGRGDEKPSMVYLEQARCYGSEMVWRFIRSEDKNWSYFKKPVVTYAA